MSVCWCAPSGGGYIGGGVSGIVRAANHNVHLGCTGLMAGLARQAGGAVVANLDLAAVCPAVPGFDPRWFGVTPVGGANMGLCQWSESCWCMRGWSSGGAHSCNRKLDVSNGFEEIRP
jgi:hypothetical protein